MKTTLQIKIDKPCGENWNDFEPTQTGRFCAKCQENVIDFTKMPDSELVAFLRDKPSDSKLCGRFREDQLQKDYTISQWFPEWKVSDNSAAYELKNLVNNPKDVFIRIPKVIRYAASFALLSFSLVETHGQERIIRGRVVDAENLEPLPGVSIKIKDSNKGVTSNENGEYQISVGQKDKLVFSFVGFNTATKEVVNLPDKSTTKLETDVMGLMGEVVVVGSVIKKGRYTTGAVSTTICTTDSNFEMVDKLKGTHLETEIMALSNPTTGDKVVIVPRLKENSIAEELKLAASDWVQKNAFQKVEDLVIYDLQGKHFKSKFRKLNDGEIEIDLQKILDGVYIVRIVYRNEKSREVVVSSLRLEVLK
ncbi:MAG: carboxypeptidase-like regulatory domain-containing protein [Spirosomataceae bacterium]